MRHCYSLFIFLLLVISTFSCSKDEDPCADEKWEGLWKGEMICNEGFARFPVEFEIKLDDAFYDSKRLSLEPCYLIFEEEVLITEGPEGREEERIAGRLQNDTLILSASLTYSGTSFFPEFNCVGYLLKE